MPVTLPQPIARLEILRTARRNAADYFAPLLHDSNDVLRTGAWCAVLERDEVSYAQYPEIIALCRLPGIRQRAIRHFLTWWDYEWARQALAVSPEPAEELETAALEAELAADVEAQIAAQIALYRATGRPEIVGGLVTLSEQAGGWRRALGPAVDAVVLNPHDPMPLLQLMELLQRARQIELIEPVVALLAETGLHPAVGLLHDSGAKLLKGNAGGCLKGLERLSAIRMSRPDAAGKVRAVAAQLVAEALEKLGDYRKAYAAYAELNKIDQGKPFDLKEFGATIEGNNKLVVPQLPPDPRTETFVMTGFPRSGTTLLENALASHPLIETFEEVPTSTSMQLYLDLTLPNVSEGDDMTPIYLRTRERYYAEIDRLHHKAAARVLIDKMPMRSAEAVFLKRLFPDKRFIFSIRHPFDVVLSCFKQQFARNTAMEHFRTFEGAVKLYDFTMTQWFGVHTMDDPLVHYLKYDELVTSFEETMRETLTFLGVEWDDAVTGFAAGAETRAARTPSYQKVRQGLSIGIQTQWRNYGFLFQTPEARPLFKWAEYFGYGTT
jgi:tetratricopeptide (TPR) repeat protein